MFCCLPTAERSNSGQFWSSAAAYIAGRERTHLDVGLLNRSRQVTQPSKDRRRALLLCDLDGNVRSELDKDTQQGEDEELGEDEEGPVPSKDGPVDLRLGQL